MLILAAQITVIFFFLRLFYWPMMKESPQRASCWKVSGFGFPCWCSCFVLVDSIAPPPRLHRREVCREIVTIWVFLHTRFSSVSYELLTTTFHNCTWGWATGNCQCLFQPRNNIWFQVYISTGSPSCVYMAEPENWKVWLSMIKAVSQSLLSGQAEGMQKKSQHVNLQQGLWTVFGMYWTTVVLLKLEFIFSFQR